MRRTHLLAHLRDIIILPFTVTVIVPYLIYKGEQGIIPDHISLKILGGVMLLSGGMLFFYTVFLFDTIGKGTLAPWASPRKLVVVGPYKYCRNPMITGVFFILIGEAFLLHSNSILIWAGVFFLINTLYFIWKEEPALYERFGEDYLTYKENVPRWMPRLKPYELKA